MLSCVGSFLPAFADYAPMHKVFTNKDIPFAAIGKQKSTFNNIHIQTDVLALPLPHSNAPATPYFPDQDINFILPLFN